MHRRHEIAVTLLLLGWSVPTAAHMPDRVAVADPTALNSGSAPAFARLYVDLAYGGNGRPGWVRAGDMDNDCDVDLVAGGGNALFIYENDGAPVAGDDSAISTARVRSVPMAGSSTMSTAMATWTWFPPATTTTCGGGKTRVGI